MRIVFADDTNQYDGRTHETRPLGGTETSVCHLTEALAARGHEVLAYTNCARRIEHRGVTWVPLAEPEPPDVDAFVAVVHPHLYGKVRRPRRRFAWLCWPPDNLARRRKIARVWWWRAFPIFVSEHQVGRYPRWIPQPKEKIVIPFGLPAAVRGSGPLAAPPPPRAIFASNPVRNLDWLLDVWAARIQPRLPRAELHVYGLRDYHHRYGREMSPSADRWLERVPESVRASVRFQPIARPEDLYAAMRGSRVMLYGGHDCEVFCLAVAEAQALGVPAVVRPIAVLPERVSDGVTGFVRADDEGFAEAALALLADDDLWRRQHLAALAGKQGIGWPEVAERFEALFRGEA